MKVLKSWLQDYVKIDQSDEQLDDLLTFSGTLVEEVTGKIDARVVAAKILEINDHPNADRLHLVKVTNGKEEIDLVCGANNIEVGQIVPLAGLGAQIGEIEIQEAEIRGEKSRGMLCSARELGLSDDHSGIYLLPQDCQLGQPVSEILTLDSVFDLEITPNRGDCLSHLGVAREIAILTDQKLKIDPSEYSNQEKTASKLRIEINNPDACFRYWGGLIKGVKVAPSPDWLKARLEKVGLKSINNIVDITNFIMMDLGQPLHAFDREKIAGETIIVRNAVDDEKITTIDEFSRELDSEMLVIADEEKALAVAGVMGGKQSAISDATTEIILESAVFERKSIRRTAKILKLTTDASYRYERGIDAELTEYAFHKAAKMICEIAGGELVEVASNVAREENNDWVKIEPEKINQLLGTDLASAKINKYFESLGFQIKETMALPPSWRHDVTIWQDLAEEIARLYGFSKIPLVEMEKSPAPKSADFYFKENIKDMLVAAGFSEVFTYPFLSDGDLKTLDLPSEELLEVANPVQSENKYMRNSLIPGLMRSIAKNPTFDPILIFEFGNVFSLTEESNHMGIAASGKGAKNKIIQCLELLVEKTGVAKEELSLKEFSRDDLSRYKIKKSVVYAVEFRSSILVDSLKKNQAEADFILAEADKIYREVSKFPPVNRDLAFVVDRSVAPTEISQKIYQTSEKVFLVEPFDEFADDRFGENKKSVAFHIWLQDLKRTLSDQEADEEIARIVAAVQEGFAAQLRQ